MEDEEEEGAAVRRYDHEKLQVYRTALAFVKWRQTILRRPRRGIGDLADQLTRASASIPLNIAEACGEFSGPDRARLFRYARRSATECLAALDVVEALKLEPLDVIARGRALLRPVVAMLTRLVHPGPS